MQESQYLILLTKFVSHLCKVHLFLKGVGSGRNAVAKGLQISGLKVLTVTDKTPVPYNGCRPCKRRRV